MNGLLTGMLRLAGGEWQITFTTRENPVKWYYRLKDFVCDISIRKSTPKRSKTANDFMWAMCTDIGNAMKPPLPKEMVYRQAIRDVGVYQPLPIREDAVERFKTVWESRGTGWFVEIVDDCKFPGYKKVFAYFGSSTYNTAEMSRVIDYLKQDMDAMGLAIPIGKDEWERLLKEWGQKS